MKKNNGPLIVAPRDNHGNKMIWDESAKKYVVNEKLYAKPLLIAPVDYNGDKMVWDDKLKVYISKKTGQVYSTLSMSFVEPENKDVEVFMEEAALEEAEKYGVEDYDKYDNCVDYNTSDFWPEENFVGTIILEEDEDEDDDSFEADAYRPKQQEKPDENLMYCFYEESEYW